MRFAHCLGHDMRDMQVLEALLAALNAGTLPTHLISPVYAPEPFTQAF